jgi:hypothetical protein
LIENFFFFSFNNRKFVNVFCLIFPFKGIKEVKGIE